MEEQKQVDWTYDREILDWEYQLYCEHDLVNALGMINGIKLLGDKKYKYIVLHTGYTSRLSGFTDALSEGYTICYWRNKVWGEHNRQFEWALESDREFCQDYATRHKGMDGYAIIRVDVESTSTLTAFEDLNEVIKCLTDKYCAYLTWSNVFQLKSEGDLLYVKVDCSSG